MRPMDNDPKGNDPIDRDPTNEEIVAYLHNGSRHWCPVLRKHVGTSWDFDFRTEFQGTPHCFMASFVDLKDFKVLCCNTEHTLGEYDRGNALKSLLLMRTFSDVEAFAVACRNALGDSIDTFSLTGSIFVNGQCVDKLLDAQEDKRFAKVFVEPVTSPAEDKTDGKELAEEVNNLKKQMRTLIKIVTILCESKLEIV